MTVMMTGATYLEATHNEALSGFNVGEMDKGVQRRGVLPCPFSVLLQEHLELSTKKTRIQFSPSTLYAPTGRTTNLIL